MNNWRGRICASVIATWLAGGCATPVPDRALPGGPGAAAGSVIGVVSSGRSPLVDVSGLPYVFASRAEGGTAGALAGAALTGYRCLYLLFTPALPVCLGVATVVGAVAGAAGGSRTAAMAPEAKSARESFQSAGGNTALQSGLRQQIMQLAANRLQPRFVDLGDAAPGAVAEAAGAAPEVDRVLDIDLYSIAVNPTSDDRYGITLTAESRLFRVSDGATEWTRSHFHISPSFTLEEWNADGATRVFEAFDEGVRILAQDIFAEAARATGQLPAR